MVSIALPTRRSDVGSGEETRLNGMIPCPTRAKYALMAFSKRIFSPLLKCRIPHFEGVCSGARAGSSVRRRHRIRGRSIRYQLATTRGMSIANRTTCTTHIDQ